MKSEDRLTITVNMLAVGTLMIILGGVVSVLGGPNLTLTPALMVPGTCLFTVGLCGTIGVLS